MIGKKLKIGLSAAAAGALALGVAVPSMAQNQHQNLVNALLDATAELARSAGFYDSHSRHQGSLRQGQERRVTLDLDAGTNYMAVAQCDGDCSDIDMWLYDENGNLIDSDVLVDDTPIVEVTPIRDARFTIRVRMVSCSVQPCYYGVGVYGQ